MTIRELWIGGYGPRESAHGRGLATFRDLIETETDGEISVRITWNIMEDGRSNTELLELVEGGEMFMCYFSSSYLAERVPALNVIEVPYLFGDLDEVHRVLDGSLGERLAVEVRENTGFEVLGFWDNGFRHFTNHLRPVFEPNDCSGMRVRVQPNSNHEALIRSWGAQPIPVELSTGIRMITNLEVDAQENPMANTVAYGIDEVHDHVTMTGHLYGARGLWAHRKTLVALPDDVQTVIARAASGAIGVQRREAAAAEDVYRSQMESRGIDFVDLDAGQRDVFRQVSSPAIEMAKQGVAEDILALAKP